MNGRGPNTRVQRTRSSPSALRSPLTRHPLGVAGVIGVGLVAALTLGCGNQGETPNPPAQALAALTPSDPLFLSAVAEVRLERLGCFGTCPIYTVALRNTGGALFIGREHVARQGEYIGRFQFADLGSWLDTQSALLERSEELPPAPDAERVKLTFVMRDGHQVVKSFDSRSSRPELWAAAMVLDGIAGRIEWTKADQ